MLKFQPNGGKLVRWSALAMTALLASCGYAKRSQVESDMARLREEMQAGDQALAGRIDQLDGRVKALEADLQALRDEFNVTIEKLEGMLAFNVPVHFDFNASEVRPSDQPVLDRFAAVVKAYYPNAVVTVEGFTDPAGSKAYNLRLGKARAEAVKEYLATIGGIDAKQIRTVSYGKAPERLVVPGASGPGPEGMPNRRVSLVIDYSGPELPTAKSPTT